MIDFLGEALWVLGPFLVVLTVLVFVHELGHYLVARWNRVDVEVFSIGFGPEIVGWNDRRGTRWKISWIPLGGYVKFFGDANAASGGAANLDHLPPERRMRSFHFQPLSRRAAVVAAGPIANFLLAILLFAVIFATAGQPFTAPVVGSVDPTSAAAAADIRVGDRIVKADGQGIERFEALQRYVQLRPNEPIALTLRRGEQTLIVDVTPRLREIRDGLGNIQRVGQLGIRSTTVEHIRHDPLSALWQGTVATADIVGVTFVAIRQMIVGSRGTEELAGVIGIAHMSKQVAQVGLLALVQFAAFLSVSLGLINLFPIPVLDGGHLVLFAAEAIRGKPLSERVIEYSFRFGLALVLMLVVLTTFNDLSRLQVFGLVGSLFG
ncbi:MAG: RIP metalloprotease RseP [Alphaproteobacteria bacterium]|nr:RIP metalloprotease RseP [Alphaproteobacteria bacterium]